ncbi:MAG: DUF4384 domain-containing protein, partial [Deltaproteobacteria bacterium]|nr:DUF4384 domain-containing protein [Deltaproteobacteria bacterium]
GKFEISPQAQNALDQIAKRYQFTAEKRKKLDQEAQKEILRKLQGENQPNPTEDKTKEIMELAKKWGIDLPKPGPPVEVAGGKDKDKLEDKDKDTGKDKDKDKDIAKLGDKDKDKDNDVVKAVKARELLNEGKPNPNPEKENKIQVLAKKWGIEVKDLDPVPPPPPPKTEVSKARELLNEGKFREAEKLLQEWKLTGDKEKLPKAEPGADPQAAKLLQEMDTRLELAVKFQYQRPRAKPSEKLALTSPRLENLNLTPKDNYRVFIETLSPAYLYVFQVDAEGRVDRLFPNPFYNKTDNPVLPLLSLQIPFTHSEWLYLEEISKEAPPKKNTLYFLASPWPAKHLDELYGKLHQEANPGARNEILKKFMAAIDAWKTGGVAACFFQEITFFQVAKAPPAQSRKK